MARARTTARSVIGPAGAPPPVRRRRVGAPLGVPDGQQVARLERGGAESGQGVGGPGAEHRGDVDATAHRSRRCAGRRWPAQPQRLPSRSRNGAAWPTWAPSTVAGAGAPVSTTVTLSWPAAPGRRAVTSMAACTGSWPSSRAPRRERAAVGGAGAADADRGQTGPAEVLRPAPRVPSPGPPAPRSAVPATSGRPPAARRRCSRLAAERRRSAPGARVAAARAGRGRRPTARAVGVADELPAAGRRPGVDPAELAGQRHGPGGHAGAWLAAPRAPPAAGRRRRGRRSRVRTRRTRPATAVPVWAATTSCRLSPVRAGDLVEVRPVVAHRDLDLRVAGRGRGTRARLDPSGHRSDARPHGRERRPRSGRRRAGCGLPAPRRRTPSRRSATSSSAPWTADSMAERSASTASRSSTSTRTAASPSAAQRARHGVRRSSSTNGRHVDARTGQRRAHRGGHRDRAGGVAVHADRLGAHRDVGAVDGGQPSPVSTRRDHPWPRPRRGRAAPRPAATAGPACPAACSRGRRRPR